MKFFLYQNSSSLPKNQNQWRSIWIEELFSELSKVENLTQNPYEADFFITEISAEANYPNYDMRGGPWPVRGSSLVQHIKNLPYFDKNKKHVMFYHNGSPEYDLDGILNIPYFNNQYNINRNFIMAPPAIKKYKFNKNIDKKYLISFKGTVNRGEHRKVVYKKLKTIHNNKNIIIVEKNNNQYDYDELMTNSLFTFCLEGHLPWSYRFSEIINAGSLPIIITEKWEHLPFCNLVDHQKFALQGKPNEIEQLINRAIKMNKKEIEQRLEYMSEVNELYFKDRKSNVRALVKYFKDLYKKTF